MSYSENFISDKIDKDLKSMSEWCEKISSYQSCNESVNRSILSNIENILIQRKEISSIPTSTEIQFKNKVKMIEHLNFKIFLILNL